MSVPVVDVLTLASEMDNDAKPFLLDVREPHEAVICAIEGSTLIPLGSLPQRFAEIPKDRPIVVQCHHGGRSAKAVQYLLAQGFSDVRNLTGGIEAWALEVDQGMARY
jgi:rhodanese-related sulfurtransferase